MIAFERNPWLPIYHFVLARRRGGPMHPTDPVSAPAARILLDNCVPQRLAAALDGFDVAAVVDIGWARLTDRELLDAMTGHYDVLITVDRSIRHQQRIHDRPIAVVVLRAPTNRLR
jgi:hypothetical protein